jgi:chondroitin AC lyase
MYNLTKIKRSIKILLILIFFSNLPLCAQEVDFQALIEKVQSKQYTSTSSAEVDEWVSSQNSNGTWDKYRYGKLTVSTNKYDNHLERLRVIAYYCTKKGHKKYNNSDYKEAVKRGLKCWQIVETEDPNWWYNQIYFPQHLGEILILMREFPGYIPEWSNTEINEFEILKMFEPKFIDDITIRGAGANAVDISTHYFYRAILTRNAKLLREVRDFMDGILVDNIKGDLCYQDHGPQLQLSSYGWVYCYGLFNLIEYFDGTPVAFDIKTENFATLLKFIRDVQLPSIRGRYWDFSVNGRSVSRPNILKTKPVYLEYLKNNLDQEHNDYYQDAIFRTSGNRPANHNVPHFNRHYWNSDYSQHSRKDYLFTVRNTSTRTVECESGNGENLKANYFSYGATCIMVAGDEYYNIMPIWDWAMIPGITCKYGSPFPKRKDWGYNYGSTNFVGGISDGDHGVAVLDYDKEELKAKKSWFMLEKEIVCLGTAISNASDYNARTTINQCWLQGDVYYVNNGDDEQYSVNNVNVDYELQDVKWVRNRNVAYYFPLDTEVKLTCGQQSGSWKDINSGKSAEIISGDVFKLWIEHDKDNDDDKYAYIIVPNITTEKQAKAYSISDVEILSNTKEIQAVYCKSLNIYQIVFYKPGTIVHESNEITVDKACVIQVKGNEVILADPTHSQLGVNIGLKIGNESYSSYVIFPNKEDEKGSSIKLKITEDFDLGLKDVLDDYDFKIFPNPNNGLFNISINRSDLLLYDIIDMSGTTLQTVPFVLNAKVDLSMYSEGIHVIRIRDENNCLGSRKVIKK